jgi:hypothetical protein
MGGAPVVSVKGSFFGRGCDLGQTGLRHWQRYFGDALVGRFASRDSSRDSPAPNATEWHTDARLE